MALGFFFPWLLYAQTDDNLQFVENKGQFEKQVLFRVQLNHGYVYLEKNAITFKLFDAPAYNEAHKHLHDEDSLAEASIIPGHAFQYVFHNSKPNTEVQGLKPFPQTLNYFLGKDKSKWASKVSVFSEVLYKNIYDGIDLLVYSQFGQIKYHWLVSPNANVKQIGIRMEGLDSVLVKANNLLLKTSIGSFVDKNLQVWQESNKDHHELQEITSIPCNYTLENNLLTYHFPKDYNHNLPLIIDPILVFSTYSGSKGDNFGFTATFDAHGNLYAGGITDNTHGEYPVTKGAFQDTCNGGFGGLGGAGRKPVNLPCDITISKYDSSGKKLMYATYVGGNDDDYPHSMVVNSRGELVVFGTTYSSNFPMLNHGYDTSHNSDTGKIRYTDIMVFKLSHNGDSLLGATFYGGGNHDGLTSSALRYNYADDFRGEVLTDKSDNIFVVSNTNSKHLPMVKASKDTLEFTSDGLCLKFSNNLDQLLWATYFGGNRADAIYSLEFDHNENIYVAGGSTSSNLPTHSKAIYKSSQGGVDGFVACFKKDTFTLEKCSYYGTSSYDQIYFLEIDNSGTIYATGQTQGNITPSAGVYTFTKNSGQFIFIADDSLNHIKKQTVFGSYTNYPNLSPSAFLVDSCGNIYISGWGDTYGLPLTADAIQKSTDGEDFYLAVFGKNISRLLFATYFGGSKSQDHVDGGTSRFDKRGVIYQSVCSSCPDSPGATISDFPTTSGSAFPKNVSWRCSNAAFKIDFQIDNRVKAKFLPDSILCGPADIQFTNVSKGMGQYQWNFGDKDSSTAIHPIHSYKDTGKFTVQLIAIDSNACNFSDTALEIISVLKKPTALFTITESNCVKQVEIANKSKDYTVLDWDYGDGTSDQKTNPGIHSYDTGKFTIRLIADAKKACSDTAFATFEIDEITYVKAAFSPDSTLCGPAKIQFKNYSDSTSQFKWDFGDNTFSTVKNPFHNYPSVGNYTIKLMVTDSSSCNINDSIKRVVSVLDRPDALFDFKEIKCESRVALRNRSLNYNLLKWDFGDSTNSNDSALTNHTYKKAGNYVIKLFTDNGYCSDSISKTIVIKENTYISAGFKPDTSLCGSGTVQFTNYSSKHKSYYWNLGDGTISTDSMPQHTYQKPGNYTVKLLITDTSTCNVKDSFLRQVNVIPQPKADFDFKIVRCDYTVGLTNKSTDYTEVIWNFGDGKTSLSPNPGAHTYSTSGPYSIELITKNQMCTDTLSKQVVLNPKTYVTANFVPDTFLCGGGDIQFSNLSDTGIYFWEFGDGSKSILKNPMHSFTTPGEYTVKLLVSDTSTCNLNDTATRKVNVIKQSKASFSIISSECVSEVEFINTSKDYETLDWDFGDGERSDEANPGKHIYRDSATYIITLITNAGTACQDTSSVRVKVNGSLADKFIPINVFTPDGDGYNDCFKFGGDLNICSEVRIIIYNRWGQKVYETTDYNACWNGRVDNIGRKCPEGTYLYLVDYKGESKNIKSRLSGTVTLIREE